MDSVFTPMIFCGILYSISNFTIYFVDVMQHHCRACGTHLMTLKSRNLHSTKIFESFPGDIFCGNCTKLCTLPLYGIVNEEVRVCTKCYDKELSRKQKDQRKKGTPKCFDGGALRFFLEFLDFLLIPVSSGRGSSRRSSGTVYVAYKSESLFFNIAHSFRYDSWFCCHSNSFSFFCSIPSTFFPRFFREYTLHYHLQLFLFASTSFSNFHHFC
jgi:hypothetical protein